MSREPTVSKLKHRDTVNKRDPYAEAINIRKHHPYEEWHKMREKMDKADLRKKTETNVFADFLSKVMPTGQASKGSPPPPPPPQKVRRGTQTTVTSASVTANPSPPIKELKYEPSKQDEEENDDDFVEDEAFEYGR